MITAETKALCGRVILAGFEGAALPPGIARAVEQGALGGVVVFKRNVKSAAQVAGLLGELQARAPAGQGLIAAIDQEGGRVVRLGSPLTVLPPARRLGQVDNPQATHAAGRLVGKELRALGFTVDFAPVLDVDTNPDCQVIGDRSYGSRPEIVVRHGLSFARGLRDGGVFPCGKHFPGHGDTAVDSHLGLPRAEHDRERLEQVEIEPFAAWARTGLGPLMVAHVLYPALDPERPATTSRAILQGEARDRLGFGGPLLSDDLEMGAVEVLGGAARIAVQAIRAGIDGLLVCRQEEVREAVQATLVREATTNRVFHQRIVQAAARLGQLAVPPGRSPDPAWIGSAEHCREQERLLADLGRGEVGR